MQVEALNQVVRKLEEKEQLLQNTLLDIVGNKMVLGNDVENNSQTGVWKGMDPIDQNAPVLVSKNLRDHKSFFIRICSEENLQVAYNSFHLVLGAGHPQQSWSLWKRKLVPQPDPEEFDEEYDDMLDQKSGKYFFLQFC